MNFKYVIFSLIFFIFLGCDRATQDTSKIKINLQDQQENDSLATCIDPTNVECLKLKRITIQVTADDMPFQNLIVNDFSSIQNCCFIDVPQGKNRLFQIFATYHSTENFKNYYYYSDVRKDLEFNEESFNLNLALLNSSDKTQAVVSGRYYDDNSNLPTGHLDVFFQPPNGSPKILFEVTTMAAGWFTTLAISNLKLQYSLNNQIIFDHSYEDFSNLVSTDPTKLAEIYYPKHYVPDLSSFGGNTNKENPNFRHIIGYFGASASTDVTCYEPGVVSIINSEKYRLAPTGAATVEYKGTTVSPSSIYILNGGIDKSNAACSLKTDYTQVIKIIPGIPNYDGWDKRFNYLIKPNYNSTRSGNTLSLTWYYLPDVTNQIVYSWKIFAVHNSVINNLLGNDEKGYTCKLISEKAQAESQSVTKNHKLISTGLYASSVTTSFDETTAVAELLDTDVSYILCQDGIIKAPGKKIHFP